MTICDLSILDFLSTAQNITGKSILLLDKSDLKDMDIVMGKRLELFEKIKALHPKNQQAVDQEAHSNKQNSNGKSCLEIRK
jgi:hypothetical protein